MSDDRKYKQRGYMDHEARTGARPQGFMPGGKRLPVITQYKETVKCAECGQELGTLFEIKLDSTCPRCKGDLHTCRNCRHFDPSKRFECAQPIKERIAKKAAANRCESFTPRAIVVKELGQTVGAKPDDARKALEALFKK